jgi:predicted metal-dependent phosphoesterase TrpH
VIDLHLHTTASDGTLDPGALITRAHGLGVRTLSVTDHDTMSGIPAAAEAASALGLEFLPGIEITAVMGKRDVHLLAYFLDQQPSGLESFLVSQLKNRVDRARQMAARLDTLGVPIEIESIVDGATETGRAIARPLIARALVDAGHARTEKEAFDRWIGDGGPGYVPREGSTPANVVRLVSRAGGVTSLAHPGLLSRDSLIPSLSKAGLAALEVYHPAHNGSTRSHYAKMAERLDLALTGGSDFHGDGHHRASSFGTVGLPRESFIVLLQRLLMAHSVVHGAS